MNALKKTPVLNRHCLRNKIKELSPLLQNVSWGHNKDSLFQATWSYYASGCQERLSSIRRRIEQNARIVAPTGGQMTPFRRDCTSSLSHYKGVDLEDLIYREFVSCFRSEEAPAKVKSPAKRSTVQKELKSGYFPTPEQWLSWKREEEQLQQALHKSKDPYLNEELSKKLAQLKKLTSRRPLIVLPNQKEVSPPEEPKKSLAKKSKRDLKSVEPSKQPEPTLKPGPYVNRISKAAVETPQDTGSMGTISQSSKKDLASEKHLKSKSSKRNLINKSSKMSYASQIVEHKSAGKVQNQRKKSTSQENEAALPSDPLSKYDSWDSNQAKQKSTISSKRRIGSMRKAQSWHSSVVDYIPLRPINRNSLVRMEYIDDASNFRLGSSVLRETNFDWDLIKKSQDKLKSTMSGKRRMGSIRKVHSWHSSLIGYTPFKAINRKSLVHTEYIAEPTLSQPAARESDAGSNLVKSKSHHGWPLPVGLRRDHEYVNPYGQYQNRRVEADQEDKDEVQNDPEIDFNELRRPSESNPLDEAKRPEIPSPSRSKTACTFSDHISEEDVPQRQPLIIADVKADFMKTFASQMSFKAYPCLLKPNALDPALPELLLKQPQVKKAKKEIAKKEIAKKEKARKEKAKCGKAKKGKAKEKKAKKKKTLEKMPSKREKEPCSLCNLVRRRQSELRPYMKQMQKQRQRLELKTYYTQKILQKQDTREERRHCVKQVLTTCYQALNLCHGLLEQRLLQKSQECQAHDQHLTG